MDNDSPSTEDRRSVHQMAIQLLMYESELAWSRFNVLLVANSIIIPGVGLLSVDKQPVIVLLLSAFGATVCVLLGIIIIRGLDFHEYWEAAASELEGSLSPELQLISRSVRFRRGEPLMFTVASQPKRLELRWRHVRSRAVAIALISLFILIYAVLFVGGIVNMAG